MNYQVHCDKIHPEDRTWLIEEEVRSVRNSLLLVLIYILGTNTIHARTSMLVFWDVVQQSGTNSIWRKVPETE